MPQREGGLLTNSAGLPPRRRSCIWPVIEARVGVPRSRPTLRRTVEVAQGKSGTHAQPTVRTGHGNWAKTIAYEGGSLVHCVQLCIRLQYVNQSEIITYYALTYVKYRALATSYGTVYSSAHVNQALAAVRRVSDCDTIVSSIQ